MERVERTRGSDLKRKMKWLFSHENSVLAIIVLGVIAVMAVITHGRTLKPDNVKNVLLQSSQRGIASIGQAFVIITANFDLSVGGVATMTALLGAGTLTDTLEDNILGNPIAPALGMLIMLLSGVGIGAANGFSIASLRMPALIVTLAMWQITKGIGYVIGEGFPIAGLPSSVEFAGQGQIGGVPVPIIVFIIVAVFGYLVLNYTTFGKSVYGVGGNPVTAYLAGIKVPSILVYVYLISGSLAALAGLVGMGRAGSASLNVATNLELDSIASVVIGGVSLFGGKGTLFGVVLGVIVIGVIHNGMVVASLNPFLQQVVKGAVLVLAVAIDAIRSH